ncbi:MAG: aspartate kinase, partial [Oscillospiraceae bacterium]
MGIKVVKFGGSSLADSNQFAKVAEIIKADKDRKYVVASAPGKRFKNDEKVTDLLYECYKSIYDEIVFQKLFNEIKQRYNDIIQGLNLNLDLTEEYNKIESGLKNKSGRDYAASRGEYLNSIILAEYLGFDFINAADVIFFDDKGVYDSQKTMEIFSKELKKHDYAVVPGFYGSMPNDTIKTFSRGGSDVTGSIV